MIYYMYVTCVTPEMRGQLRLQSNTTCVTSGAGVAYTSDLTISVCPFDIFEFHLHGIIRICLLFATLTIVINNQIS